MFSSLVRFQESLLAFPVAKARQLKCRLVVDTSRAPQGFGKAEESLFGSIVAGSVLR
jgi:hypothetical protein